MKKYFFKFEENGKVNPILVSRFYEDLLPLLRHRVDVILLLGLVLVPFFGVMDYFLYPAHWRTFLVYRFIASIGCLTLLIANRFKEVGERSFYLGVTGFYLVGGIIIKMILELDSFSTPYYAGLNLVFIGFCLLVPVRMARLFLHTLILYAVYLALILALDWSNGDLIFIANNSFVLGTLIIAFVGAQTNMHLRWKEFQLRVELEQVQEVLRQHSTSLEVLVDKKQQDLILKVKQLEEQQEVQWKTQRATIFGLAKLADSRDKNTGEHLGRLSILCREIASELCRDERYRGKIDSVFINNLADFSMLHDLGKVAIPDSILLKPGLLTEEEYETIKRHTVIGGEALRYMDERLGEDAFIEMGREIALFHHERFDGRGYPHGLKGEEIPLSARIVAVADTYDALIFDRCYQAGLLHEEAVEIIRSERGTQFHPDVVDAFLRIHNRLYALIKGEA